MKILHNFANFSPATGGGTVTVLYQLMRGLVQRGHEITLYTSDIDHDQAYISSLSGVKVYEFNNLLDVAGFCITPEIFAAIKRDITSFDIIHLHCQRSLQHWPLVRKAKQFGVPYIIDSHGSTPIMGRSMVKQLYDMTNGRYIYPRAHYIAQSDLGKQEYINLGIDASKISIISPLPFPVEDFQPQITPNLFRQQFVIPPNKHIILSMGRLHRIKGVDRCIAGFQKLMQYRNDVVLVIAGADDGDMARLKKMAGDNVYFVGHIFGSVKLSALSAASVMIQTSLYEQEAWAPFEAVLCGTPIIVSSHTGAGTDVKQLDAGYLVNIYDPNDVADKIDYVLNHLREVRSKATKAADYLRREATVDKVVEKYEAVYDKLHKR